MTPELISLALECPLPRAMKWSESLTETMVRFEINTPLRQACFLAQLGHESARLIYTRERWNPTACPWQSNYEGNVSLGNKSPGDGFKYLGRGLIQITGRYNYRKCGEGLGEDFESAPYKLEQSPWAAFSAGWFWESHGLNQLADEKDYIRMTKRINGGLNGYDDRVYLLRQCSKALNIESFV